MGIIEQLHKVLSAMEDRRSIPALLTWPKFSLASFIIVSRLTRRGISPKTVLDLGANVGQFAIAAAKLFQEVQIHSFEPDPEASQILRKNVSRFDNITVHQMAVGDTAGEIDFNVNKNTQVSSILPLARARINAFPDAIVSKSIKVKIETLDNVFLDADLQRPILLKIDVQGYEDRVIKGAERILTRIDYIVAEVCFHPLYEGEITFTEIVYMILGCGFKFLGPLNWHLSPITGEVIEMDVLFGRINKNH